MWMAKRQITFIESGVTKNLESHFGNRFLLEQNEYMWNERN